MIINILEILAVGEVEVELDRIDEWGLYEENLITIRSTLSLKNKVRTLIHECLHHLFPDFKEDTILLMERDLYRKLTKKQFRTLAKYLN